MRSPTARLIDAEIIRRELARRRLSDFFRYRFYAERRRLDWNWHLDLLCELLEAQTLFQIPRLMVNMPPRFLKSELATQTWQAWMIGRDDSADSSMVSASYAATLAARDSAKTLGILGSQWYKTLFPAVAVGKATEVEWNTKGGAGRVAAGALGPITGKGGTHLLGDDLLKPMDANSEVIRSKTNDWYGEVFRSRLNDQKRGTITIIAQRLHEQDVCGHLLTQQKNPDADQWYHVNLPLENITGKAKLYSFGKTRYLRKRAELLHEKRIGTKEVKALKAAMRANFEGQYNQRPQKMSGGKFRPALLCRMDKPGEQIAKEMGLIVSIYIDLAVKEKQVEKDDPDFSAFAVMGRDQLQRKWILDMWYGQTALDATADALIGLWTKWAKLGFGPRFVKGEKIGLQHALRPMLLARCRAQNRGMLPLIDVPYAQDATLKLAPFEGALNAGQVWVPGAARWLPDLEAEMRSIPRGAHDDLSTAISYGIIDLEDTAAGEVPMTSETLPAYAINEKLLKDIERRRKALLGETDEDDP